MSIIIQFKNWKMKIIGVHRNIFNSQQNVESFFIDNSYVKFKKCFYY